ncbi:DUF3298 and DUF4163 domain-containing protein [Butyrivibrio sp. NC3005]|uniref:DUF3298 and DUF4163 domain-containing protein n=1 Tax=Butyrivibrio sp. NC3005 TaxID=1280685 RepID=UPI00040364FF|nr:DUF3298 and DUF4163 domain-containing protein [Butyrivibrio sp. NC3005]
MRKRFLAMLTTAGMCFSLFGCSAPSVDGNGNISNESGSETSRIEEQKEKVKERISENSSNLSSGSDASNNASTDNEDKEGRAQGFSYEQEKGPSLLRYSDYLLESDEKGAKPFLSGHADYITLDLESSRKYSGLHNALSQEMKSIQKTILEETKSFAESSKSDRQDGREYESSLESNFYTKRVDSKVLSILGSEYSYAGGAHPSSIYDGLNYDVNTGNKIKIKDVISNKESFRKYLETELPKKYGEESFFDLKKSLDDYFSQSYDGVTPKSEDDSIQIDSDTYELDFYMDANGITVFFNTYDIAPYAVGLITVFIPYSSELVNENYKPFTDISYASEMANYMDENVEIDGEYNKISIETDDADESDYHNQVSVRVNDKEYKLISKQYCNLYANLVALSSNQKYIMVYLSEEYDCSELYIVKLGKEPSLVGKPLSSCDFSSISGVDDYKEFEGYKGFASIEKEDKEKSYDVTYYSVVPAHVEKVRIDTDFNLLSTYSAYKDYSMNDDGSLISEDKYYIIKYPRTIVSKDTIECEIVDENGNVTGKENLPAKTKYAMYRTDGIDKVDAKLEDGRIARFTLTSDDEDGFYNLINGKSIFDLFEELFFAG